MTLLEQARKCRLDAQVLADRPEAPFLLRIALAFEELARLRGQMPDAPGGMEPVEDCQAAERSAFFLESAPSS